MSETTVGVIGGGPCGLLAALLLARAGTKCVVFERKTGISTHPKAMGLSRRTMEIFRQLGLEEKILEGSLPVEGRVLGLWAKSLVGEELGSVPLVEHRSDFTPCASTHCPQTWTEKVLLEAVQNEPLASICFGGEVASIDAGADSVRVNLKPGETCEFPWLIAADGAGSGMRHQLGIETVGPGDMGHFVNVMFRAQYGRHLAGRKAILYHALSEEYFENFVAVDGNDIWLMHHFLQPGEKAEDYSAERFAEIIRHVSGLPDEPVEVLGLSPWVMSPKAAMAVRAGRVFLAGDAAARLSPAGGLGLNTGLQSTHNLAWKLALVVHGRAGDALLDSYQEERCAVALATMQNTNRNAEEVFAIVTAGLQGEWDKVRELISHSRRGGSGLGQDLGVSYEKGAFLADGSEKSPVRDAINDYIPCARPGHRAPHLWIKMDGAKKSILDLFGAGFRLLAGRAGGAWTADGVDLEVLRNNRDFVSEGFENLYGIQDSGAVLVRPDGCVGARFPSAGDEPSHALRSAMDAILAR